MQFFLFVYIALTELNKGAIQKGEMTLFLRGSLKRYKRRNGIIEHPVILSWEIFPHCMKRIKALIRKDLVKILLLEVLKFVTTRRFSSGKIWLTRLRSRRKRVILDHVDGWVKPGQITVLMGASGAGKTTLLNCLSDRVTTGVITNGVRMVNGHELDSSFQRSIGYVQQQDVHLQTSTVREALQFSAYLRQSNKISKKEKDEYVDYVIDLLEMTNYADALVGVAGEGLNVEQRKRLTIGVELVAKPKLLLFWMNQLLV